MLSADKVSDKEHEELTKLLDSLKDEDLEVVESYEIFGKMLLIKDFL